MLPQIVIPSRVRCHGFWLFCAGYICFKDLPMHAVRYDADEVPGFPWRDDIVSGVCGERRQRAQVSKKVDLLLLGMTRIDRDPKLSIESE